MLGILMVFSLLSFALIYYYSTKKVTNEKTKIFTFWPRNCTEYLYLTLKIMQKKIDSEKYNLIVIDEFNIKNYIKDVENLDNPEFIKIYLLEKYGGVWIDIDTILIKNPVDLFDIENYDFVCFGEEVDVKVMASRKNGEFINKIKEDFCKEDFCKEDLRQLVSQEMKNGKYNILHHKSNINGEFDKNKDKIDMDKMLSKEFKFEDFLQNSNVNFIHIDKDYLYNLYFEKETNIYEILSDNSFIARQMRKALINN